MRQFLLLKRDETPVARRLPDIRDGVPTDDVFTNVCADFGIFYVTVVNEMRQMKLLTLLARNTKQRKRDWGVAKGVSRAKLGQ